jgi:CheY-like chemotaxis protein
MDEVLQSVGYRVLKMQSAEEALEFCERSSEKLDLLLTDVVMPGRNGRDLARELGKQSPTMRTLFMSGNGENVALLDRGLDRDCHSGDSSFFSRNPRLPEHLVCHLRYSLGTNGRGPNRLNSRELTRRSMGKQDL